MLGHLPQPLGISKVLPSSAENGQGAGDRQRRLESGPQSPELGRIPKSDGWGPHLALQAPAPPLQLRGRRKQERAAFPKFN